uniref:CUB domain-containing protein n=1 Tax=Meloidogyne hapla TaxID=6305 RepID=A0A1I8BSQ9_MELHA
MNATITTSWFDGLKGDFLFFSTKGRSGNTQYPIPLQIPTNSNGYRIMLMNGLFRKSSQPIRYAVYLIWVQFYVS